MLFVIALLLAGAAVFIAQRWVKSIEKSSARPPVEYRKVIVAAADIPQWQRLEEANVTEKNWPKDAMTQDMFTEKSQVIGKTTIDNIFKEEPLNARRVIDSKGGGIFSLGLPENKRAFTVRANDVSGVGGVLLPDNRIDVLVARKKPGSSEDVSVETLLQDIRILAVDQDSAKENSKSVLIRSVTLEMTPQQAEEVFKAESQGSLKLTLRNPVDKSIFEKPEKMERSAVLPPPQKPVKKPVAPVGRTFTIIRGINPSKVQCQGSICSE
jgi:pilus assembly protein CpaB